MGLASWRTRRQKRPERREKREEVRGQIRSVDIILNVRNTLRSFSGLNVACSHRLMCEHLVPC